MNDPRIPAGAIPLPADLMHEGARFGLHTERAVCELFGHRPITMYADPESARRYGWPADLPVGRWCPGCGAWL